jgi:hypothetical protein
MLPTPTHALILIDLAVIREGDRILLGAERRLFETCLAMIVDMLAADLFCDDTDFGLAAFDNFRTPDIAWDFSMIRKVNVRGERRKE